MMRDPLIVRRKEVADSVVSGWKAYKTGLEGHESKDGKTDLGHLMGAG